MTRAALLPIFALLACSPAPSGRTVQGSPSHSPASNPSRPFPARPITRSEENERIRYSLLIPAEAAALPTLRERLLREAAIARTEVLGSRSEAGPGVPAWNSRPVLLDLSWTVRGQSDQLLSLTQFREQFTGGAHPTSGTEPLIWDRRTDREVRPDQLFTDWPAALATLRPGYCRELERERRRKTGSPLPAGNVFPPCPAMADLTIAPAGAKGGRFTKMLLIADPYVAGSYAEGAYEVELPIPQALLTLVAPAYCESFRR